MASAAIVLVCGLNFQEECQDWLRVNLDADETLAYMIAEVNEVPPQNRLIFYFFS